MKSAVRSLPGFALTDVAIAIGVFAVLLAAVTASLGAIESGRISSAERSIGTLQSAAINWLANGRTSYAGISIGSVVSDGLLAPSFSGTGTNPWGGNFAIGASGSGGRNVRITLTNVPNSSGQALVRKFRSRAQAASFASGTFSVTF